MLTDSVTGKEVILCRGCGLDLSSGEHEFYQVKTIDWIYREYILMTTLQSEAVCFCHKCYVEGKAKPNAD